MRQKRQERLEQAREALEAEFLAKLVVALHRCRQGQWGLFDQNAGVDLGDHLKKEIYAKSGAEELDRLAAEISETREALGMHPFPLYAQLQAARGRKSDNALGEPRLAEIWLQELED